VLFLRLFENNQGHRNHFSEKYQVLRTSHLQAVSYVRDACQENYSRKRRDDDWFFLRIFCIKSCGDFDGGEGSGDTEIRLVQIAPPRQLREETATSSAG
jgi:hypothetical protein